MVADKGKKPKVAEEDKEDQIDGALVLSIEKLQEIQDELEKINEEASDKVLEVEQKYNKVRVPIYGKRTEIINAIPDFWLTAFLSHPALCMLLNQEDQKIFKYMSSLEVEDSNDLKSGYSITMNFNTNPYFEDKKLTKTYSFPEDGSTKITSTPIKWKEGMGISNGEDTKKKGNKRAFEAESFFLWFNEIPSKDMDDIYDEIADVIKEDLWPNPLTYFNSEGDEEEDLDADEEDDEDDEDDEEDGEEEDN